MGSLSGRKILVTAGGTREFIDNVRVMTNISTGQTARYIAEELLYREAEVYYICANSVSAPYFNGIHSKYTKIDIVTVQDLMVQMKNYITYFDIDTVIHAAAVSDFTFERDKDTKLSSSSSDAFIEYLSKTIRKTPKIISLIKKWNPNVTLIGFKYTVGKTQEEQYEIAETLRKETNADLIIANDQKEIERVGAPRAHLLLPPDIPEIGGTPIAPRYFSHKVNSNSELSHYIIDYLSSDRLKIQKEKCDNKL